MVCQIPGDKTAAICYFNKNGSIEMDNAFPLDLILKAWHESLIEIQDIFL